MNWSLSKYGTFKKCRRKFLYAYIQRLPAERSAAADRGVGKHTIIEEFFTKRAPLPADLSRYEGWLSQLRDLDNYPEHKVAMRDRWLPTTWEDPEAWWKGVLDLKVLQRPKAWVFDWKTGKVYPDHIDQKELYAIATFVEHEDITEVEAWHVYLDLKDKDTKTTYHRDDLTSLIAKWDEKLAPYEHALRYAESAHAESWFVTNPSYL